MVPPSLTINALFKTPTIESVDHGQLQPFSALSTLYSAVGLSISFVQVVDTYNSNNLRRKSSLELKRHVPSGDH
jgi:hypothetical protein